MTDWGNIGNLSGQPTSSAWSGSTGSGGQMDPVVKQFFKNMVKTYMMINPNMAKTFPAVAMKNPAMAKQMVLNSVRNEGLNTIFQKYGPIASIMFHEGGPLGLGTTGPMGMGIQQSMMRDPLATWGKLKFAMAFPAVTGIGWLMDKFLPSGGERGGLGATFGPRLADAASKIFPGVQSTEDWLRGGGGTGIMGGTFMPRIKKFFGNVFGVKPSIEEIEVTAQKRPPRIEGQTSEAAVKTDPWSNLGGMAGQGYLPQGAQIDLSKGYGKK